MEAHAVPRSSSPTERAKRHHALLSDERLARLVGTGDGRAFAMLYRRYHQPLYRYCRSMLHHDHDAQDALQSAMTSAYAALGGSQRDAPVRPWLFRIAHNEAISMMRRRRPQSELDDDHCGVAASVEDQQADRERLAQLVLDLRQLPERQRAALVMRELSGLSHEEIALVLRTSVGAAKQAVFEARRSLQAIAEGRAMSCDEVCLIVSEDDKRKLRSRRVRAHLRNCAGCSAFKHAIPDRSADLRALAPPLPTIAATSVLARVLGSASVGTSSSAGSGAGVVGGLGGKAASLGLTAKTLVGVAVVSSATFAVTRAVERRAPAAAAKPGHHLAAGPARAADQQRAAPGFGLRGTDVDRGPLRASHSRPVGASAARIPSVAGGVAAPSHAVPGMGLALGRAKQSTSAASSPTAVLRGLGSINGRAQGRRRHGSVSQAHSGQGNAGLGNAAHPPASALAPGRSR
jgi:RNA polymerase sigma factor (sigma-70 family)